MTTAEESTAPGSAASSAVDLVPLWVQALALAAGFVWLLKTDVFQWLNLPPADQTLAVWLFRLDSGIWSLWLAALPLAWLLKAAPPPAGRDPTAWNAFVCATVCGAAAVAVAAGCGWSARHLPPLYHDEFSYLFQAQTFLAGRVGHPPPFDPAAFQQMHVLDAPAFASRYFPGTGLALAPALAWFDLPVAAIWCCVGLTAVGAALAGRRFGPTAGWLSGGVVALSPGMVAFGNLLHSPVVTTAGLAIGLAAFFAAMERRSMAWAVAAGLAIGFAFLTRPMTAVGMAGPLAVYALLRLTTPAGRRYDLQRVALMAAAFGVCALGMAWYNVQITGRASVTPYGLYTERHTPSHSYG
ncbi:MAG: ArnT family glycosyltransferase, partial [Planctomycetia bacterium]